MDGTWLFMPEYQLNDKDKAISVATDDKNWHVMSVPNFWNPIRIWLHGETMPSPTGPQHLQAILPIVCTKLQLISSILLFVRVKRKMGKYQRRVIF